MATNIKSLEKEVNDSLGKTNERMDGMENSLEQILGLLKQTSAKNTPTEIRPSVDAEEFGDVDLEPASFIATPDGPEIKEVRGDVDQEVLRLKAKAEVESFMKEKLTVQIHPTSEENAQNVFQIGVNGDQRTFTRGVEFDNVPRYIVEGLARARPITYENEQYTMADGTYDFRYPAHRGVKFPFAVIGDSDKGNAWLKQILQER